MKLALFTFQFITLIYISLVNSLRSVYYVSSVNYRGKN
jgi:hypothetical protein